MSSISIIGAGNMARALATRALAGGNAVEIISRDPAKAEALAAELHGATVGAAGDTPAGDVVILAVLHGAAAALVREYGEGLRGKVVVDITNPVNADATGLVSPEGRSGAQQIADAAPADAHVVKAFNTVFSGVLAAAPAEGRSLDIFIAGDDADAKARVSAFVESLGLRPLDAGPLAMALSLEHAGLMMIGLIRHSIGNAGFSLGVDVAG